MAVAPAKDDEKRLDEAAKLVKAGKHAEAENIYKQILTQDPGSGEQALRNFERALVGLGELFRDQKRSDELADLIRQTRSAMSGFAKSKTAKLGMCFPSLATLRSRYTILVSEVGSMKADK